ncbi:hypothetical protein Patl1_35678 [Pistacia atlantica]|nr:hypothetical protein Patl1_35678 [Pistacia atlantica]
MSPCLKDMNGTFSRYAHQRMPKCKDKPCTLQLSPIRGNNFKRIRIIFKPATNKNKVIGNEQAYLQDTDAVYVLDAIVVFDHNDEGTREASTFEDHILTMRQQYAVLVDNLNIANIDVILNGTASGETLAFTAEFKLAFETYLKGLVASPADVIAFNEKFSKLEMNTEYGQSVFLMAQATDGIDDEVTAALLKLEIFSRNGFEKLMRDNKLDALVTPGSDISTVLAIGGFPGISVPAGYDTKGEPFGICFGGLKGTERSFLRLHMPLSGDANWDILQGIKRALNGSQLKLLVL